MYQLAGFFRVEPSSMLLSLFISDTTFKMTVIVVSSLWLFVLESLLFQVQLLYSSNIVSFKSRARDSILHYVRPSVGPSVAFLGV